MKRAFILLLLIFVALSGSSVKAEFQQIDLTVFGMD